VILVTLLFLMTSASGVGLFSKKLDVHTYFENSAGLKQGAAVNLDGVAIGEVKTIVVVSDPARRLTPVRVDMKIDERYARLLKQDSKAALTTVGVLGDTVLDINSQTAVGPPLRNGEELHTLETPSLTDVVKASQGTIESVNVILAKMNTIVDDLKAGKGTAGQIITNPELYNQATATVAELHKIETGINNGQGSVGKLMKDDELYNRLNETVAKLDAITASLNQGQGTAGKLLKDETLYNNLNKTIVHANDLMTEVDKGKGAAGMLINDPAFADKLRDTVNQVDLLMAGVNQGKGTLGKLASDDEAYTNLNKLLSASTDLVTTIRQDPKKYLTFHVKIF
jgi:phospholipid/cholesterol/gamma-HCH transport system substrate-binding protein